MLAPKTLGDQRHEMFGSMKFPRGGHGKPHWKGEALRRGVSCADKEINSVAGARGRRGGSLKWEQVFWFKDMQEAGAAGRVGEADR